MDLGVANTGENGEIQECSALILTWWGSSCSCKLKHAETTKFKPSFESITEDSMN